MKIQAHRRIIYLAGFLFSVPIALTSYINSSYLKKYLSSDAVGMLYVVASLLTIVCMLEMPRLLSRIGNRYASSLLAFLSFLSLILTALGKTSFWVILGFTVFFICSNLLLTTLDIFVEDFSKHTSVGKFRGLYLVFINIAWVMSQAVSGTIIAKSSFQGLYLLGSLFMILVSLMFLATLHDFKDPQYKKVPILRTIKLFIKNKDISKIYLVSLILKFFIVWMVIYTPIYLNEYVGFGWDKIGLIFTVMLVPFVVLTYPLGRLSDKIGEKSMLIAGFIIATIFTMLIPLIQGGGLLVWAGILFMTRVGAATIEVMSESYFFKKVDEEHADTISFFRNTGPVSFVIAPLVALPVLYFAPTFEYIFFILGAILLAGLYITLRIRDVK